MAVLAVVDEDSAALLLEPFGRHQTGVLVLEPPRKTLSELVRLGIRVPPRDRHEHVNAVGAARLDVRAKLEPLERLADEVRNANGLYEPVARLRRVEVEEDEVRAVRLVHPRVPGVHVDAVHLHHPDERGGLVDEREVDEP